MSEAQDRLHEIFYYSFDRKNRRIYFGDPEGRLSEDDEYEGDFTWHAVEQIIRGLHILIDDSVKKPIELHMMSIGGDVYAMLRLIDEILTCPCQIKFIGGGQICSAATWIMAVCDERYLHANTQITLHDGIEVFEGKNTDTQIESAHSKTLQAHLNKILAENSHMPEEFWSDILQRDVYITATEAISLGLADKIIEPKKRGNLRRTRVAAMNKSIDVKSLKKLVNHLYRRINRRQLTRIDIRAPKKEECDKNVAVESETVSVPLINDTEIKS